MEDGTPYDVWAGTPSALESMAPSAALFGFEDREASVLEVGGEGLFVDGEPAAAGCRRFSRILASTSDDDERTAGLICERLNHRCAGRLGGSADVGVHFWKANYNAPLPEAAYEAALGSVVHQPSPGGYEVKEDRPPGGARVRVDLLDETATFGIGPTGTFLKVAHFQFDEEKGVFRLERVKPTRDFLRVLASY